MSALSAQAAAELDDALAEHYPSEALLVVAQVATGRAVLALQEETEVVAEQLRRLADVAEALLLLMQPLADRYAVAGAPIEELIARSSLGEPDVVAARASVSDEQGLVVEVAAS